MHNCKKKKSRNGPVSRVLLRSRSPCAADGHFSRTPIARRLQQPTRESLTGRTDPRAGHPTLALCLALLQVGFTEPVESPRLLVRSYRTVSPLPRGSSKTGARRARGGLLSVALSLTRYLCNTGPVDVIDHPVLRSPDFPLAALAASGRPARCETTSKIPAFRLHGYEQLADRSC